MRAAEYAAIVTSLLPAADPRVAELVQAAQDLDTAVDTNAATLQAVVDTYHQRLEAIKNDLIDRVFSVVPISELRDEARRVGLADAYQLHADAQLGPLYVAVESPAAQLANPVGGSLIAIGPMPPNAFQARLEAGPVVGNGALVVQDDALAGLINARLGPIEVAALASLAKTPAGGPSFLGVFAAGFTPGLQLGFGFQISRIGGVVGVERAIDRDAMAAKPATGPWPACCSPWTSGQARCPPWLRSTRCSHPGPAAPSSARRSGWPGSRWPAPASPPSTWRC